MKLIPKQIPKSVKAWLMLLGFWGGNLINAVLMGFYMLGFNVGLYLAVLIVGISLASWYFIGWKYLKTLEEWGLVEPKEKKNK